MKRFVDIKHTVYLRFEVESDKTVKEIAEDLMGDRELSYIHPEYLTETLEEMDISDTPDGSATIEIFEDDVEVWNNSYLSDFNK